MGLMLCQRRSKTELFKKKIGRDPIGFRPFFLFPLPKQPLERPGRGESLIPTVMPQFGISDENGFFVASLL